MSATVADLDEAKRTLEAVGLEFPDLPLEVLIKEDLLRRGVWFTKEALERGHEYARKSYFIFSFDRLPLAAMTEEARDGAPEEIALSAGPHRLQRVIVSVRLNPDSPYVVDADDSGGVTLGMGAETLARVEFSPRPPYYGALLSDGTPITEVAPSIEWGYLLYLTVFRMCQYFGKEEECQFCDINRNFRQQRALGRPYFAVKPVARLLEALELVEKSGSPAKAYTLTGGSITSDLEGLDEASFYIRYAEAIEARFQGRWIGKMVVQALPKESVARIRRAGIRIYHPNYEIWDKDLFAVLCPGKSRFVGRDVWIQRILDAAEVFGPSAVIPNFVAGIEMSKPHGFVREEDAWHSTGLGLEFFMSRGIVPRFTTYCPEPLSVLGQTNGPASLRYHAGLLRTWRDIHASHGLPAPPGYGTPGLGQGVFSVSSFMDVIAPGTRVAELLPA